MYIDPRPAAPTPRRRGVLAGALAGLFAAALGALGLRARPRPPVRMVERDGWFLDASDR